MFVQSSLKPLKVYYLFQIFTHNPNCRDISVQIVIFNPTADRPAASWYNEHTSQNVRNNYNYIYVQLDKGS